MTTQENTQPHSEGLGEGQPLWQNPKRHARTEPLVDDRKRKTSRRASGKFTRKSKGATRQRMQPPFHCYICLTELNDANWSPSQQKYRRFACRNCWAKRQKAYSSKHPIEAIRAKQAEYRSRKKMWSSEKMEADRRRRYGNWLKRNYGITIDNYDSMLASQGGRCALCGTDKPRGRGRFHVDHCHKTNNVRALLCTECNMMLGLAKDSVTTLQKAANYIAHHQAEHRKAEGGKKW